jgi:nitroreductase
VEFSRSIIEIIKERSSRRSYTPQPVETEKLQALGDFFVALKGPFGGEARFVVLDTAGWGEGKMNALGTYGTMQGARVFIVGIIRRGEHDMEDFGYQFEQIILRATDLGLGTCWIGGIFNRSRFADKAGVREHEVLPAISPLGYPTPKRSVTDSILRWTAGSRNRRPWGQLFFHGSFEMALPQGAAGCYRDPLEMLRLGPSASNRQPWRVVKEEGKDIFHFYLRRSKGYDKLIKAVDLQRIDMGIAMSHFELTARELGLSGRWENRVPLLSPFPERTEYVQSWIAPGRPH